MKNNQLNRISSTETGESKVKTSTANGDNSGSLPDRSVAVIVINYNGGDALLRNLNSIRKQSYLPTEIVVVDNDSTDGSVEKAREQFPDVTFIENSYNAGWGVGCNAGIQATKSEFIALLNNDAYLDPLCIEKMVHAIRLRPDYGSCASKILLWDDPKTLEAAGVSIYRDGSSVGRGRLQPAEKYNEMEEVFCACDCCCLYRREMLDKIGLYDPDFFIYCDETDIGWRHQLAGWKCVYTPQAIAYHMHSRSAGSYSDFKAYHVERNRIFLCMKYFPPGAFIASMFFAAHRYMLQVRFSYRGQGALAEYRENNSLWQGFKILLKAHWEALKKAPRMLRRRREFMSIRRLSNRKLSDLFERYGVTAHNMAKYM